MTNKKKRQYEVKRTVVIEGVKIRKSWYGKTKREAERKYNQWLATLPKHTKKMPTVSEWVLNTWLPIYKEPTVAPITYENSYREPTHKHILPAIGHKKIDDITTTDIQALINNKSEMSERSQKLILLNLRSIFGRAVDEGVLDKSPVSNIKIHKQQREELKALPADETKDVIKLAIKHNYIDILLMICCGLRRSEMLCVRWSDIDWKQRILKIRHGVAEAGSYLYQTDCKTRSSRRDIPIPELLFKVLVDMFKESPSSDFIVCDRHGKMYRPRNWHKTRWLVFKGLYEKCYGRVLHATPHVCRKTYASILYNLGGVSEFLIGRLLGHSESATVGVTGLYIIDDLKTRKEAVKVFDTLIL